MSTIDGKDAAARKAAPMASGLLDYFPDALIAVAELSKIGNDQHNPGQPLHWSRGKSNDHPDCLVRHLVDRGRIDTDGVRHSAKVAWRALAILQLEIEAAMTMTMTSTTADIPSFEKMIQAWGARERRVGKPTRRVLENHRAKVDRCSIKDAKRRDALVPGRRATDYPRAPEREQ